MSKIIRFSGLFFVMFTLSGCMDLNVSTGIDKDYTAFLEYNLRMDLDSIDSDWQSEIKKYLDEIKNNYQSKGFKIDDRSEEGRIDLIMTLKKKGSSYDEAYKNLQSMLQDSEMTFLLNTDITTSSEEFEQGFTFSADTDVTKILNTSFYSAFPMDVRKPIEEGIKSSKINFTLTIPSSKIIDTNGVVSNKGDITQIMFPVSMSEPSSFKANARWSVEKKQAVKGSIDSLIKENKSKVFLYKILTFVLVVLVFALIVGIVLVIVKRKKNPQSETETSESTMTSGSA